MKKIIFAGGCFWGVEKFFSMIPGVKETEVGYANGNIEYPSYKDICNGDTNFAEVCLVAYDSKEVSLDTLLDKFWNIIDPTSINKQGNDVGNQYRSGIYYIDDEDLSTILMSKRNIETLYKNHVVTEVKRLENYYKAEE